MQPGDVTHTFADIEASRRDLGFEPVIPIETGLKNFVGWYRGYHAPVLASAIIAAISTSYHDLGGALAFVNEWSMRPPLYWRS
jgi:hypothetical protein